MFIEKARFVRQRIGGGMRQAGYMAAAGIVALQTMRSQAGIDNENAASLAKKLYNIAPDIINPVEVQTNIVMIDLSNRDVDAGVFHQSLKKEGVLIKEIGCSRFRMICHKGVGAEEIATIVAAFKKCL
jgi:threonine aldolase